MLKKEIRYLEVSIPNFLSVVMATIQLKSANAINERKSLKLMTGDDMPNIATLSHSQNGSLC